MVKLSPKGHSVIRMHGGYTAASETQSDNENRVLTAADFGMEIVSSSTTTANNSSAGTVAIPIVANTSSSRSSHGVNLFADSYVPSFFR